MTVMSVFGVAPGIEGGRTSTITTVPRTAAMAFGVRISIASPGRIRLCATLTASLPQVNRTV